MSFRPNRSQIHVFKWHQIIEVCQFSLWQALKSAVYDSFRLWSTLMASVCTSVWTVWKPSEPDVTRQHDVTWWVVLRPTAWWGDTDVLSHFDYPVKTLPHPLMWKIKAIKCFMARGSSFPPNRHSAELLCRFIRPVSVRMRNIYRLELRTGVFLLFISGLFTGCMCNLQSLHRLFSAGGTMNPDSGQGSVPPRGINSWDCKPD